MIKKLNVIYLATDKYSNNKKELYLFSHRPNLSVSFVNYKWMFRVDRQENTTKLWREAAPDDCYLKYPKIFFSKNINFLIKKVYFDYKLSYKNNAKIFYLYTYKYNSSLLSLVRVSNFREVFRDFYMLLNDNKNCKVNGISMPLINYKTCSICPVSNKCREQVKKSILNPTKVQLYYFNKNKKVYL